MRAPSERRETDRTVRRRPGGIRPARASGRQIGRAEPHRQRFTRNGRINRYPLTTDRHTHRKAVNGARRRGATLGRQCRIRGGATAVRVKGSVKVGLTGNPFRSRARITPGPCEPASGRQQTRTRRSEHPPRAVGEVGPDIDLKPEPSVDPNVRSKRSNRTSVRPPVRSFDRRSGRVVRRSGPGRSGHRPGRLRRAEQVRRSSCPTTIRQLRRRRSLQFRVVRRFHVLPEEESCLRVMTAAG